MSCLLEKDKILSKNPFIVFEKYGYNRQNDKAKTKKLIEYLKKLKLSEEKIYLIVENCIEEALSLYYYENNIDCSIDEHWENIASVLDNNKNIRFLLEKIPSDLLASKIIEYGYATEKEIRNLLLEKTWWERKKLKEGNCAYIDKDTGLCYDEDGNLIDIEGEKYDPKSKKPPKCPAGYYYDFNQKKCTELKEMLNRKKKKFKHPYITSEILYPYPIYPNYENPNYVDYYRNNITAECKCIKKQDKNKEKKINTLIENVLKDNRKYITSNDYYWLESIMYKTKKSAIKMLNEKGTICYNDIIRILNKKI